MPTENSDTIVPITAANFSTESNNVLLQTEQPVQNLPMEEGAILRKLEFCLIQVVKEVIKMNMWERNQIWKRYVKKNSS